MRHLAHNTIVDEMGIAPEDKVMLQVPGILHWQSHEPMRQLVEKNKGFSEASQTYSQAWAENLAQT